MNRRSFLGLLATPAIVQAANIMPVRVAPLILPRIMTATEMAALQARAIGSLRSAVMTWSLKQYGNMSIYMAANA